MNVFGYDFAINGKYIKKKTFKTKFTITFPILIPAYKIGRCSALNFEKGMITNASKTRIQIAYIIYCTSTSIQFDNVFLKNKADNRKKIDVQKSVIVDVSMTLFLFCSVL